MKNLKFREIFSSAIVLIALFVCLSSCEKEDEVASDYVGTWITAKIVPMTAGFTTVNYTLTLTDNSFTETFFENVRQSTFQSPPPFVTIEGSIAISGNHMNFLPQKISFSKYNSTTATASEPYLDYTNNDQDFNVIFKGLDFITSSYKIEFELVDDQLILKMDINEDGDSDDAFEIAVYTRQ